ncbi:MAG: hypothetical protein ACKESB_01065 [Candidatus Hodgkinia cicadicola]
MPLASKIGGEKPSEVTAKLAQLTPSAIHWIKRKEVGKQLVLKAAERRKREGEGRRRRRWKTLPPSSA